MEIEALLRLIGEKMFNQQLTPKTDAQAEQLLAQYTGNYRNLVLCQYRLSREQGKSIKDSLDDVHRKVGDTCANVIRRNKLALGKK